MMTQLPCDIVKDLLPLYEDNVCSEKSKDSVEEHLSVCDDCRDEYEIMHEKLPRITEDEESSIKNDVQFIKKVSKEVTFKQMLIIGIMLLIVCIFLAFISDGLEPLFYLSSDNVEIAELYKMKNGDIFCTFESDKNITLISNHPVIVPRKTAEHDYDYDNGWTEIALHSNPFHQLKPGVRLMAPTKKLSFVFTLKKEISQSATHKSKAIYLLGKFNKKTLIWKEGQNIASAPKAIEDKVSAARAKDPAYWDSEVQESIVEDFGEFNGDLLL